ncbi:unnamed protein product [Caretta caretta]
MIDLHRFILWPVCPCRPECLLCTEDEYGSEREFLPTKLKRLYYSLLSEKQPKPIELAQFVRPYSGVIGLAEFKELVRLWSLQTLALLLQ